METIFSLFRGAHLSYRGYQLAETLFPFASVQYPDLQQAFFRSTNAANVISDIKYHILYDSTASLKLSNDEGNAWVDVYVAYWSGLAEILKVEEAIRTNTTAHSLLPTSLTYKRPKALAWKELSQFATWATVFESWKELTNTLIRGYSNGVFEAWTIPCLYVTGKYLRIFAIKADEQIGNSMVFRGTFQDDFNPEAGKNEKLEDAARVLNRMFQLCISDRAPLEDSRKWAIYNIVNLLFKTYFKLNSVSLSKNILRALQAGRGDMPELKMFPKSHQVTFKYYVGVIFFLEENYVQAEENLTEAWNLCLKYAQRNKELILTYLIPCHLLTTHTLPTQALLEPYPHLQDLFLPLSRCIKRGDLAGFDAALVAGEDEFVKRRIYLTLERGRDITLRNLLRRVFIVGGFEEVKDGTTAPIRRTRIPVAEFGAAISIGSKERLDNDEVECLLANMIYKNLMKGYISRERRFVVLSKGGAFPGTGV